MLNNMPDASGKYPVGATVSFYVDADLEKSVVDIIGADKVEGSYVELQMSDHRFITVYIWELPTLDLPPSPTETPTPSPTPGPNPAPEPVPVHDENQGYPPGGRIAFQTNRDGDNEIYVMGCDGSDQVNLTGHDAEDKHPSWGGNGLLAFSSNRNAPEDGDDNYDIYLISLESKEVARLTAHTSTDESPALSPDRR